MSNAVLWLRRTVREWPAIDPHCTMARKELRLIVSILAGHLADATKPTLICQGWHSFGS